MQLHEAHSCNTDSILSTDRVIPKAPEETLSAFMVKKQNSLYKARSFMCQKDLGIIQCGRRQRRFNLGLDCMWCGLPISQEVYKCKRYNNVLRKRLQGKFILSHYYLCCIYRQLCVIALKFFTYALISVDFLLHEVDLTALCILTMHNCFKAN